MIIDKTTSNSLMIANLIATVLVIAIHYNSKVYIQPAEFGGWNYLFQEFALNGVARISVPFFAMLSGFFIASKLTNKKNYTSILKNRAKTLLLPYLIAAIVIYLASTGIQWAVQHESFQRITTISFIINATLHPVSDQFWFLRDMIILTVLSPLLLNSEKKHFTPIALTFFVLWFINYQPLPLFFGWHLISIETLLFFTLGGVLFEKRNLLSSLIKTNLKNKFFVLFFWLFLLLVRVYLDPELNVWYTQEYNLFHIALYKLAIIFGIISLMQFSIYLSTNKLLIYLSGLTFFVYLFHLLPISYARILTPKIISREYSFYIDYPIVLISIFVSAHFIAKFMPNIFILITGGRTPINALKRQM